MLVHIACLLQCVVHSINLLTKDRENNERRDMAAEMLSKLLTRQDMQQRRFDVLNALTSDLSTAPEGPTQCATLTCTCTFRVLLCIALPHWSLC